MTFTYSRTRAAFAKAPTAKGGARLDRYYVDFLFFDFTNFFVPFVIRGLFSFP